MEIETIASAVSVDFSLIGLFTKSGLVVQGVMVILLLASFWTWAIGIQKLIMFRLERRRSQEFADEFWNKVPMDEIYDRISDQPTGASERIFCAAIDELEKSEQPDGTILSGTRDRIERSMALAISRETTRLNRGLDFLATVGSTAPFIGLFGTVWGIMRVFGEIGVRETTSLVVVAPGIGEALAATALGLMAAIPAVVFFNNLSSTADHLTANLEDFGEEFGTLLSRQWEA